MLRSLGPFRWTALLWLLAIALGSAVVAAIVVPQGFVDWLGIPGPAGIVASAVVGTSPVPIAFGTAAWWEHRQARER